MYTVHPFGEQCFQSAWQKPMHGNLMFGGVVFGKAAYGLARRAEVFISYHWGNEKFDTQAIVVKLKAELERSTRLTCWFDLDRMGAGIDVLAAMQEGVRRADAFCCCLTDRYVNSVNCMRELQHAVEAKTIIVPLTLLKGYDDSENNASPPWPPPEANDFVKGKLCLPSAFVSDALPASRLYVDLRTEETQRNNWQSLVNRIDSEVRLLRGLASAFKVMDQDKSGEITISELRAALKQHNANVTDEQPSCVSVNYEDVLCMNVAGSMNPCHDGYENKKV